MDWFYSDHGQQQGPISDSQLDSLLESGKIDLDTLVWKQGMSEWQPMRSVRPSPASSVPPVIVMPALVSEVGPVCAECGRHFPASELIALNKSWVCAACKPTFVQRLKEGAAPISRQVWRENRQFVLAKDTELPDRCVKCNQPANGWRLKRTLYYHHPAFYLLIIINLLIYAVVAICVRKRATIHVGLCPRHRSARIWTVTGCWLAVVAGIALIAFGLSDSNTTAGPVATSIGILMILGAIVVGLLKGSTVSAGRIDEAHVWVRGGRRPFLDSLPEWPGTEP